MAQTSPVTTGAAAITGAMLGGVVVYLCDAVGIKEPPADVAATVGALLITGLHYAADFVNAYIAAKNQPPAPPAQVKPLFPDPAAPPAQPQQIG